MSVKIRRLLIIYTAAALLALSGYACAAARQLEQIRLTAGYESARAFEAAVSASEELSESFRRLRFASDDALGKSLCARACAAATAAETALAVLPFETQELEKLSGFLGHAGDYAASLCALTDRTLPEEHRAHLLAYGEAAADFAARLREMQGQLHAGSIRMDTRETSVRNVDDEKRQIVSNDKIRFETDLKNQTANIATLTAEAERLISERGSAGQRTQSLNESIESAQGKIDALNAQLTELEKEITGSNDSRAETARKREEISTSLSSASMAVMSLSKDIEAANQSIRDTEARRGEQVQRVEGMKTEITDLEAQNRETTVKAAGMRQTAENNRAEAVSSREGMSELAQEREKTEKEIHDLRRLSKEKSEQREKITGEVTRLEERRVSAQKEYDEIIQKLLEEYNLTRREAEAQFEPAENAREADRKVKELRSSMKKLEPVNLGAVEEYKEVFEKYTMYKTQIADVQKSKAELNKLIETLTEQMKELFVLKFDEINGHFKTIFTELFGGGSGYLELTDRSDVLNCGIEIHAQPPGKTIKNIDLFSGGEKTVIAVAIYFAIMKVNPSPFCILDEIDSALDERNVDNIADYCRRMSDSTQYIIITHRRGTMEVANMIYGVTMQQDGVSKLLELKIDEISEKLGVD